MVLHANAALSRRQRERLVALVLAGLTSTAAAALVGCSHQTGSKWVGRYRRGEGLDDRSSRPHRQPRRTPAALEQAVLRARPELAQGPHPLGWARPRRLERVRDPRPPRRLAARRRRRARGGDPLRAGAPRRAPACRLQEARPHRPPRPSRPRRSLAPAASGRGHPLRRRRRRLAARLRPPLPGRDRRLGACLPPRKSSASSERFSRSGPTPAPVSTRRSASAPCGPTSIRTIAADHTAPSAGRRHFSASTTCLGRTSKPLTGLVARPEPRRGGDGFIEPLRSHELGCGCGGFTQLA
jgi:hypothetical protein